MFKRYKLGLNRFRHNIFQILGNLDGSIQQNPENTEKRSKKCQNDEIVFPNENWIFLELNLVDFNKIETFFLFLKFDIYLKIRLFD